MEIYSRQIRKFNEESLSYSEMDRDDSAYMKVDALQKRLLKTWEEFCRLQNMSPEIVVNYNTKTFIGTEYEELNKKINRLLNKSVDCFPDYVDVLTIVQRCTIKHNLPISPEEQSALSRRLFQDIIKELKRRRQGDFINHFGSHLTDQCKGMTDPALQNSELNRVLERHHIEGEEKMAKMIEEFTVKQETNPQRNEHVGDLEGDETESEKDEESEGGGMESEEKNGSESDHSTALAEVEQQNSFEMTLELGKDDTTVEGDCMDITQDGPSPSANKPPLPPLLPVITEQYSISERMFVNSTTTNADKHNQDSDYACNKEPQEAKKEYSYDIIVIDD